MKQSSDQLVEWLYTVGFSEQAATILRRVSNDWYILKNNNLNDQEDMLIIIKGEIIKKIMRHWNLNTDWILNDIKKLTCDNGIVVMF